MDPATQPKEASVGYWVGWCVLFAAITQLPLIVVGVMGARLASGVGAALLFTFLPGFLMLVAGAVGLLRRQFYGYWCTYLATFFGAIGGLRTSFIPFIQRWLNIGPHTGDLFLAINLVIVGVLAWEHYLRLHELEFPRQRLHRIAMICIFVLGLGVVAFGRSMEVYRNGEAPTASAIPVAGPHLASLKTEGPVNFVSVQNKLMNGIDLVYSGKATEENIRRFVETENLKPLDKPAAYAKILPRSRKWNLSQEKYPTKFAPPDLLFIGRVESGGKAVIQLAWRKSDGRFTGEIVGSIQE